MLFNLLTRDIANLQKLAEKSKNRTDAVKVKLLYGRWLSLVLRHALQIPEGEGRPMHHHQRSSVSGQEGRAGGSQILDVSSIQRKKRTQPKRLTSVPVPAAQSSIAEDSGEM